MCRKDGIPSNTGDDVREPVSRFPRVHTVGHPYDRRVTQLFTIIRQLEQGVDGISEDKFNELLDDAILACGFADEVEALRAALAMFGNGWCGSD